MKNTQKAIAIIGISCRLPGEAVDPDSFWKLLTAARETRKEFPSERSNVERFCTDNLSGDNATAASRHGHFLRDPISDFDAPFFRISRTEAAAMDPQHRLLLEESYHAFEDAGMGIQTISGSRTGVYVGFMNQDYMSLRVKQDASSWNPHSHINVSPTMNAARLSYFYNLHGPSMVLDTMCSSSIVALHLACQALRNGECEMAVAAGVNLNMTTDEFIVTSLLGALAPDGRSKAYSADANGYAKGEGIAVVVLKPLDKAILDGNKIYGVVRGTATNHDGNRKRSITVPSFLGQTDLLHKVYADARVNPAEVCYVEAHATGTSVGDPIESKALGSFFGAARRNQGLSPLLIGSVKSNIGHTEASAGLASLIKVLMMLKHKTIAPSLLFGKLKPEIDFDELNLKFVTEAQPLPDNAIIGINSFGMGGSNAHAILQRYTPPVPKPLAGIQKQSAVPNGGHLLVVSARCQESLKASVANMQRYIEERITALRSTNENSAAEEQQLLSDVCYTSVFHRSQLEYRTAFAFNDYQQLSESLAAFLSSSTHPRLSVPNNAVSTTAPKQLMVFVFSGQGPQWFAMGRILFQKEPVFRNMMIRIDRQLIEYTKWSLVEELTTKDAETTRINQTDFAQPAIFAVQVALYELWKSLSIEPDVIVGHSVGEVAAAYASGALTLDEAVFVIYHRSRLQHECSTRTNGRMLAINMGKEEAERLLEGSLGSRIQIAAINSDNSVTLGGDADAFTELESIIKTDSRLSTISKTFLRTSAAFHTHHMDSIREELITSLTSDKLKPKRTRIPLFSTVTGDRINGPQLGAEYWWNNVRGAVHFSDAIKSIVRRFGKTKQTSDDNSPSMFCLELSPHPVLATSLRDLLSNNKTTANAVVVSSLIRNADERLTIMNSLGSLFVNGYHRIDWTQVYSSHSGRMLDLPKYPFTRQSYWLETREHIEYRTSPSYKHHPLLGTRVIPTLSSLPRWRNTLSLSSKTHAFIKDHVVQGYVFFPLAGYLELAFAAVLDYTESLTSTDRYSSTNRISLPNKAAVSLKNVNVVQPLILRGSDSRIIEVSLVPGRSVSVISYPKDTLSTDIGMSGQKSSSDSDSAATYSTPNITVHLVCDYEVTTNATQQSEQVAQSVSKRTVLDDFAERIDAGVVYPNLDYLNLRYGPSFRGVSNVLCNSNNDVLTLLKAPEPISDSVQDYLIHPSILDSAFHGFLVGAGVCDETRVPVSIGRITLFSSLGGDNCESQQLRCIGSNNTAAINDNLECDMCLYALSANDTDSNNGSITVLAQVEGLKVQTLYGNGDKSFESIMFQYVQHDAIPTTENTAPLLPSPDTIIGELTSVQATDMDKNHALYVESLDRVSAAMTLYAIKRLGFDISDGALLSLSAIQSKVIPEHSKWIAGLFELMENAGFIVPVVVDMGNGYSLKRHAVAAGKSAEADPSFCRKLFADIHNRFQVRKPYAELLLNAAPKFYEMWIGELHGLDLIFKDKSVEGVYSGCTANAAECFTAVLKTIASQQQPEGQPRTLRVLEVGAGTGSTTGQIIEQFAQLARERNFLVEYWFTDISPAFMNQAKSKFAKYADILRYEVLDLEKPTFNSANLQHDSFDIILAANCVHATRNLYTTLGYLHDLLAPSGLMVLMEVYGSSDSFQYVDAVFGSLPGWWAFDDDIRQGRSRPLMHGSEWTKLLNRIGLDEAAFYDYCSLGQTVVARKSKDAYRQHQWLVFADKQTPLPDSLAEELSTSYNQKSVRFIYREDSQHENDSSDPERHFITPSVESFSLLLKELPANQPINIVYLWPIDAAPYIEDVPLFNEAFTQQVQSCTDLMYLTQALVKSNVDVAKFVAVTMNAYPHINNSSKTRTMNLNLASFIGMFRHCISEVLYERGKLIDIDGELLHNQQISLVTRNLAHEIMNPYCEASHLDEFTLTSSDSAQTLRRVAMSVGDSNKHINAESSQEKPTKQFAVQLSKEKKLCLQGIDDTVPNTSDSVEVSLSHVVLQQQDLQQQAQTTQLATRLALGTTADGKSVAITGSVPICSKVTVAKNRLLDDVSKYCDSSVQIVDALYYFAAFYTLVQKARLTQTESVLLVNASTEHSDSLAAIAICHTIGCKTILVADGGDQSESLQQHVDAMKYSNTVVIGAEDVIRHSIDVAVDLQPNNTQSNQWSANLQFVGEESRVVLLNAQTASENALWRAVANTQCGATLLSVNTAAALQRHPTQLIECLKWVAAESMPRIDVDTSVAVDQIGQLFDSEAANRICLVEMTPTAAAVIEPLKKQKFAMFPHLQNAAAVVSSTVENAYIITGGLGGIALALCEWLIVKKQASHVYLLARRHNAAMEARANKILGTLRKEAQVHVRIADCTDFESLRAVFNEIDSHPSQRIAGVIHTAMVLRDSLLTSMTEDAVEAVLKPKILGAHYLHVLTRNRSLDFFVLLSSISNMSSIPGQANYNAGNNYLQWLAMRRRSEGLPAMALQLPGIEGAGYVANNRGLADDLDKRIGAASVHVNDVIPMMETLHIRGAENGAILFNGFENATLAYYYNSAMKRLYKEKRNNRNTATDVDDIGSEGVLAGREAEVMQSVHEQIARLLGQDSVADVPTNRPLTQLGFDSLMAVQIKNWLMQHHKYNMPMAELLQGASVASIARMVVSESSDSDSSAETQANTSESVTGESGDPIIGNINDPLAKLMLPKLKRCTTPKPELRIVSFLFLAGSVSTTYSQWVAQLPADTELYVVNHHHLLENYSPYEWTVVLEALASELRPLLEDTSTPCVFYGHSLGALLSVTLTRYMSHNIGLAPNHVFIGAPPSFEAQHRLKHDWYRSQDKQIISLFLKELEIIPLANLSSVTVEQYTELLNIPSVKRELDFIGCHDVDADDLGDKTLPCPLTVYWGSECRMSPESESAKWSVFAADERHFELVCIDGPHTFITDAECTRRVLDHLLPTALCKSQQAVL